MHRRAFVAGVALSAAGCLGEARRRVAGTTAPPTEIGTASLDSSVFTKLVFFDDGSAAVHFTDSHGGNHFGVTHARLDIRADYYRQWAVPDFTGPVTVPLGRVIANHGPYPSNRFTIGVTDDLALIPNATGTFSVPAAYLP